MGRSHQSRSPQQQPPAAAPGALSTAADRRSNAAAADALAARGPDGVHVVAPGDTLWGIAAQHLGDGSRWEELAADNQIIDPQVILPGQRIQLPAGPAGPTAAGPTTSGPAATGPTTAGPTTAPPLATQPRGAAPSPAQQDLQARETSTGGGVWSRLRGAVARAVSAVSGALRRLFGGTGPAPTGPETRPGRDTPTAPATDSGPTLDPGPETGPETGPATGPEAPAPVVHTVYPGDNLWGIAQQYLGDGGRWREIADANGLDNPSLLTVGQQLVIPGADTAGPTPGPTTGPTPAPTGPVAVDPGGEGMGPRDPIALGGLRGLDHTMAAIYNDKGRYLKQKASSLGISSAAAAAVLKCESGGAGFHRTSGKMIIRFENHIFWDQWGSRNADRFREHFRFSSGQRWTGHTFRRSATDAWSSFHGNQAKEWQVLELARGMDDTAALKSISMGAAQVMGFNHRTLGYTSVQEMFDSMAVSLPAQLDGMFAYIEASNTCMTGLRRGDYVQFARGYNGPGQAEHYGALISAAAAAYARVTRGRTEA